MADNVQLPATGTGTADPIVATDQIAGTLEHYQYVKLADGTLGGTGKIGGDATNGLDVDVTRSALPTGASTLAEQQTQTASLSVLDDWDNAASDAASVSGDVAHDTADAGEPVKIGAKALALGANPTAVTANDRTNLYANRAGVLFTIGGHPNIVTATYITTSTDTQTDDVIVAVAAGLKAVITRITATVDEATTVGVGFRVGFGASTIPALGASGAAGVAGIVASHPGMVPGSGYTVGDGSGIIGIGADDEDIRITSDATTTGALHVTVTYFTIES